MSQSEVALTDSNEPTISLAELIKAEHRAALASGWPSMHRSCF